jgi:hypothetical protein
MRFRGSRARGEDFKISTSPSSRFEISKIYLQICIGFHLTSSFIMLLPKKQEGAAAQQQHS